MHTISQRALAPAVVLAAFALAAAGSVRAQNGCVYEPTGDGLNPGNFALVCPTGGARPGRGYDTGYRNQWAAIAVSDSTLAWGTAFGKQSRAAAEKTALSNCAGSSKTRDCKVVGQGENWCLALATSQPDLRWGYDDNRNGARARAGALAQCRKGGGTACRVVADPCAHDTR